MNSPSWFKRCHNPEIIRKIPVWNAKTIANDLLVIKQRCVRSQNPKKLRKKSRHIRPKNVPSAVAGGLRKIKQTF